MFLKNLNLYEMDCDKNTMGKLGRRFYIADGIGSVDGLANRFDDSYLLQGDIQSGL